MSAPWPPPHPQQTPESAPRSRLTTVLIVGGIAAAAIALTFALVVISDEGIPAGLAEPTATVPPPGPMAENAFIRELDAIDPQIVHGEREKAIGRGLNQCSSIRAGRDQVDLVTTTNARFTSPTHPRGFGTDVAVEILRAVRWHLCPVGLTR